MGNSLLKKIFGTAGVQFIGKGLLLIVGVFLARVLGPDVFGEFSYLNSLIVVFSIPVIAGLPQLVIREISAYLVNNNFSHILGIKNWSLIYILFLSVFIFGFVKVFLYLGFFTFEYESILIFAFFIVLFKSLTNRSVALINAFDRPVWAQVSLNIFFPIVLFLSYSYFYYYDGLSLPKLFISNAIAYFICFAFCSLIFNKVVSDVIITNKPSYDLVKWHKSLLPFSLMFILVNLNSELAIIFLGSLSTTENIGLFKVASQCVLVITIGLQAVNSVISPQISSSYSVGDLSFVQKTLSKSVFYNSCFAIPITILLFCFSDVFVSLVFGNDYINASFSLKILLIGQLFNVLMGSSGILLNMTGHERYSLSVLFVTLLFSCVLFYIFIPIFGSAGASLSVTFGVLFWNLLLTFYAFKLTGLKTWLRFGDKFK